MFLTEFVFYIYQPGFWKQTKQLYIVHSPCVYLKKEYLCFTSSILEIKTSLKNGRNSSYKRNLKIAYRVEKLSI